MNVDCEKIIKQLNDSEYEFVSNFPKDYINAINSTIFFVMLISGIRTF